MREDWQRIEQQILSPYATKSVQSKGRVIPEDECPIRTIFQRDRDRIIHSNAFRRLKHKTQVFINPARDHIRTRLTHTLEVSQISRTIARALSLNEDLTEAIALGHDLGHTPFGHAGERALAALVPGFTHNQQSLRVVDVLERNGKGLNLSFEVRDGILNHSGSDEPSTLEGEVVRLSDRIAYINHDIDDALRAGIIDRTQLPTVPTVLLGDNHSSRINSMVTDVIVASSGKQMINMTEPVASAMDQLREFLFDAVYFRPEAQKEEKKIWQIVNVLYDYYTTLPVVPSDEYDNAVDYIAGMTDSFAINAYQSIINN